MKAKRILIAVAALSLIIALAGCTPGKAVTTGSFSGQTYSNDFFGMTFDAPEGWYIASKDEMVSIFETTADAVGSDDKEAEKKMDLGKQELLYLTWVAPYEYEYVESNNPNIGVLCENLSVAGLVIKTSSDYAEAAMDDLTSAYDNSGLPYEIADTVTETIGGMEFAVIDATLTGDGYNVYQRMLCAVKNNYAVVFTLTWFDESELAELETIVDTISFE